MTKYLIKKALANCVDEILILFFVKRKLLAAQTLVKDGSPDVRNYQEAIEGFQNFIKNTRIQKVLDEKEIEGGL